VVLVWVVSGSSDEEDCCLLVVVVVIDCLAFSGFGAWCDEKRRVGEMTCLTRQKSIGAGFGSWAMRTLGWLVVVVLVWWLLCDYCGEEGRKGVRFVV
jgi:hypothetical protein